MPAGYCESESWKLSVETLVLRSSRPAASVRVIESWELRIES